MSIFRSPEGPVGALAVGERTMSRIIWTLLSFLVCFSVSNSLNGESLVFPQFVSGGGAVSEFLITNPGMTAVSGTLEFRDASGNPLEIGLAGESLSTLRFDVAPGGTRCLKTDAAGTLKLGYALFTTDPAGARVAISLVYTLLGHQVSVPGNRATREREVYVERTADAASAIALLNPGDGVLRLSAVLFDEGGQQVATHELRLNPRQKVARFVHELIPALPNPFIGSLHMYSAVPFVALALRQSADGAVSSIPGLDLVFPGLAETALLVGTGNGIQEVRESRSVFAFAAHTRSLETLGDRAFGRTGDNVISVFSKDYEEIRRITIQSTPEIEWWDFFVFSEDRIVLGDHTNDLLHIINWDGELLHTVKILEMPNNQLESMDGIRFGNELLFVGNGRQEILSLSLDPYRLTVYRDVSDAGFAPSSLEVVGETVYFGRGNGIYYFEGDGALQHLVDLPENNITDLVAHSGFLYAALNFADGIYRISLADGNFVKWVQGLERPSAMERLPARGEE